MRRLPHSVPLVWRVKPAGGEPSVGPSLIADTRFGRLFSLRKEGERPSCQTPLGSDRSSSTLVNVPRESADGVDRDKRTNGSRVPEASA